MIRRMRCGVPILGAALTAALLSGASPAFAVSGDIPADTPDRLRLVCAGTMSVGGHDSEIHADGLLDLGAATLAGFGVGTARVVLVTPSTIGFDSGDTGAERLTQAADRPDTLPRRKRPSTIVQGTLDRLDGALHVAVLSAADPSEVVIAMELRCQTAPALG